MRIRFTKSGDLRWISHRDLARVWERLLRRANLQLAFSQGFHPKPRISFPSALALGVEALDELVELEIVGAFELSDIEQDIRRQLPAGMVLLSIESPRAEEGKAKVAGFTFRLPLPAAFRESVAEKIAAIMQQPEFEVKREKKSIVCSTRDPHFDIRLHQNSLEFKLPNLNQGSIKASELLAELGIGHLLEEGLVLQRTKVHLVDQESPKRAAELSQESAWPAENVPPANTN